METALRRAEISLLDPIARRAYFEERERLSRDRAENRLADKPIAIAETRNLPGQVGMMSGSQE
jgi:hypothetical protein